MLQLIGNVFNTLIGKPIFNLLIIIIALLPGHNLGWAIIVFTIIIRIALFPLLRKQLHHAIAMRKLQPDIRRIKKQTSDSIVSNDILPITTSLYILFLIFKTDNFKQQLK